MPGRRSRVVVLKKERRKGRSAFFLSCPASPPSSLPCCAVLLPPCFRAASPARLLALIAWGAPPSGLWPQVLLTKPHWPLAYWPTPRWLCWLLPPAPFFACLLACCACSCASVLVSVIRSRFHDLFTSTVELCHHDGHDGVSQAVSQSASQPHTSRRRDVTTSSPPPLHHNHHSTTVSVRRRLDKGAIQLKGEKN